MVSRRYVWDKEILRFTEPLELYPFGSERQQEKQEFEHKLKGEIYDV